MMPKVMQAQQAIYNAWAEREKQERLGLKPQHQITLKDKEQSNPQDKQKKPSDEQNATNQSQNG